MSKNDVPPQKSTARNDDSDTDGGRDVPRSCFICGDEITDDRRDDDALLCASCYTYTPTMTDLVRQDTPGRKPDGLEAIADGGARKE